jgi:IS30 family transposase
VCHEISKYENARVVLRTRLSAGNLFEGEERDVLEQSSDLDIILSQRIEVRWSIRSFFGYGRASVSLVHSDLYRVVGFETETKSVDSKRIKTESDGTCSLVGGEAKQAIFPEGEAIDRLYARGSFVFS